MFRFLVLPLLLWASFSAGAAMAQERQPNHLLGAQSPYLLQHLYNPVDWYPWGQEALNKARAENKLIFVSVGYASCHWCHVMRRESFENPEVAAILNRYFVSIKIDRELRPDLDEQFMLATQTIAGTGGWPNNLILTPLGDPFYGGTYFPPDALMSLLSEMADMWAENPGAINAEGFRIASFLRQYLTRQAAAVELTPELLVRINGDLLGQMDEFEGGVGSANKFPRESLFLYLTGVARRSGDRAARDAVTALLDGMIRGGIHDQIGGGFHRYAVDPAWHVPHFEKMLYNQAMIGLLLSRSLEMQANPGHARALERLIAYVMREMRAPGGAFFAAQDADSQTPEGDKREGAYYLWTPEQVLAALGEAEGRWLNDLMEVTPDGDIDHANVLYLPDGSADPARLDRALARLAEARRQRVPPDTDTKILMGWNGALIAMLAEASRITGRPEYWQAGAEAAQYLLDRLKTDNGYQRVVYDGVARQPAQLPDLGAFALGLIALHDFAPESGAVAAAAPDKAYWLNQAIAIAEFIRGNFGAPDEGLRMSQQADGLSPIIAVDDGELPSGNAMALMVFSRLARRAPLPEFAIVAERLAATLSGYGAEMPDQRAAALAAVLELRRGETGQVRYVASGAVRVEVAPDPASGTMGVTLTMKPGWHINAHEPLEAYFVPTELIVDGIALPADAYPDPEIKALGFNPEPLALHEGTITLTAPLPEARPATARLTLQSCSAEICLEPQELSFTLW